MDIRDYKIPDDQMNSEIFERLWDTFKLARAVWGDLDCEPEEMENWFYDENLEAYVTGITDETDCKVQILIPKKHISSYKKEVA
ncbi:MAG: hypothetical protein G8D91_09220 [gamma proteobacterium symbiont of Clathrolucina costata]